MGAEVDVSDGITEIDNIKYIDRGYEEICLLYTSFLTYLSIILAVFLTWFLFKTRKGLNLRAVGEDPARCV